MSSARPTPRPPADWPLRSLTEAQRHERALLEAAMRAGRLLKFPAGLPGHRT